MCELRGELCLVYNLRWTVATDLKFRKYWLDRSRTQKWSKHYSNILEYVRHWSSCYLAGWCYLETSRSFLFWKFLAFINPFYGLFWNVTILSVTEIAGSSVELLMILHCNTKEGILLNSTEAANEWTCNFLPKFEKIWGL